MAYIGNTPADSYISLAVQHFTVSATLSYTLDQAVTNSHDIALFINNVRQEPGSGYAYTASGGTLTLSAPTATTDTMYCVFLGKSIGTIAPPADSIGTSAIADAAITDAKIGTVGASKITGTVADSQIAGMAASKLTGTVTNAQIADLDAAKLTGTVADARFPAILPASSGANLTALTAGNITGVIPTANLGTGTANATTFLNGSGAYSEAGGGAWEILTSVTPSDVASVDFTTSSWFPANQPSYALIFADFRPVTDGPQTTIQVGTSSGFITSSYQFHVGESYSSSGTPYGYAGASTSYIALSGAQGNQPAEGYNATVFVHGMNSSTNSVARVCGSYSTGNTGNIDIAGSIGGSTGSTLGNFNRIRVLYTNGNIASGRVTLYKINYA